VVVYASATPVQAREVGSAVTVVTAEQIERRQARSLADVLRQVPGVALSRSGPTGSQTQVRIRGAEANHTLVLMDGVELNDPSGASEFDFGNMLASDVERIEILRGPQSALYGSEAIGGVINIITKRGKGPVSGTLTAEGGSFETARLAGHVQGGGDWYDFSVGGTFFRTGGVSVAPESEGNSERDGNENKTLNVKVRIKPIENLEIDLFGRLVDSTIETDPQPFVGGVIGTIDGNEETNSLQRTGRLRLKYSLFDGQWEHIAGAAYHTDRADSLTDGAVSFASRGEKTRLDYQTNLFLRTPDIANAKHTFTLLAEHETDGQVTASAFGGSDLEIANYGLVGEYRVSLFDRLFLSGSVRHDVNELFDNATTFRATAAYLVQQTGTRLHGSYGTGVKNPTLFELFGFGPNFIPNPDLQPEKSVGFDIGVEQSLWDDRVLIDLTYFNNRITDLIDGAGLFAINRPGTTRVQGIELSASAEPMDGLHLSGQYTYTLSEGTDDAQLVRRPRHTGSVNAAYTFLDGKATVDLGVDYNGDQQDFQFSNFFASRSVVTLGSYFKADVTASYRVTDRVEIFGRVENALDENYQDVFGFSNPGIGAFAGIKIKLGGGR
jgi:vitamin B12 transporter